MTPSLVTHSHLADMPPPASGPAPTGLFYPHGLWAPGVRLMRNLNFASKALLIAVMFVIPLVWLSVKFFKSEFDILAFSEREISGVEYNTVLYSVIEQAQQWRRDSIASAQGSIPSAQLADVKAQLDKARAVLAETDKRLGATLGTRSAFEAVQSTYSAAGSASQADALFKAHAAHINALIALMAQATDGSNLTLDPEIDTYYLMDAAFVRLPDIMENTARLRGAGAQALRSGTVTPAQIADFARWIAIAEFQVDNFNAGIDKAQAHTPALKGKIGKTVANQRTHEFLQFARKELIDSPSFTPGSDARLVEAANTAIKAQYEASRHSIDHLKELIQSRINRLHSELVSVVLILLIGLLVAAYLFYCFYLVTRGGLRVISMHLTDMSNGDLRLAPSQPWGRDEPAQVIVDLRKTYDALHQLIRRVRHSARELNTTAKEIAAASTNLSARAESSAATLEQQAASMEEIGSTVSASAERAQSAAQFSGENAEVAERGGAVIQQVVSTMRDIHVSSTRINDIIGTIDGIAFQTNILALNAAVEAARAGESGRGFAVVAAEVRSLAQRSAEAAREIKGLIGESVSKIDSGSKVVEEAGETMVTVVANARQVNIFLSEIASAAREQAAGVGQSVQAIQVLDRDTQQNAALVEETNAAAESLRQQADLLMEEIAKFRVV